MHVNKWLDWAQKEFGIDSINRSNFQLNGAQLCSLSPEDFMERAPPFTGDVLLSHLNLLRARSGKWVEKKKNVKSTTVLDGISRIAPLLGTLKFNVCEVLL